MGRPQRVSRTFQDRRALLQYLAPRYQQASPVQKTLLLDSFVEWTGYTRKYAIELLNHGEQDLLTIQRRRLPQYRQEVQHALFCRRSDAISQSCCPSADRPGKAGSSAVRTRHRG